MVRKVKVFVSYSHKDEALKSELDEHLSPLKQSDAIEYWHDRKIPAGAEWAKEIEKSVIPIILRPTAWKRIAIAKLQAFPKDAKAITSWANRDEAFVDVVNGIQAAVDRLVEQLRSGFPTPEEIQAETQAIVQEIVESGQGENQYREEVLFLLKQDCGEISSDSRVVLEILRDRLRLSRDRAMAIEQEISAPFQEFRKAAIALIKGIRLSGWNHSSISFWGNNHTRISKLQR
jgi:hypothetical protein